MMASNSSSPQRLRNGFLHITVIRPTPMKEAIMNGLTAISFSYVIASHSPNQPRLSNICSSILLGSTA